MIPTISPAALRVSEKKSPSVLASSAVACGLLLDSAGVDDSMTVTKPPTVVTTVTLGASVVRDVVDVEKVVSEVLDVSLVDEDVDDVDEDVEVCVDDVEVGPLVPEGLRLRDMYP